jgi:uncharacterized membrane protein YhaH (DUF805 family)
MKTIKFIDNLILCCLIAFIGAILDALPLWIAIASIIIMCVLIDTQNRIKEREKNNKKH